MDQDRQFVDVTLLLEDDHGIAYIPGTRIKVLMIVQEALEGRTDHDIQNMHGLLDLAQIHAALTYYYSHQLELDEQIQHGSDFIVEVRANSAQPGRQQLEDRAHRLEWSSTPVTIYADDNVDRSIVVGLRERNIPTMTISEDWRIETHPSAPILEHVRNWGVLLTQDPALVAEALSRQARGEEIAGVIFAPKNGSLLHHYIDDLALMASLERPDEYQRRVQFLPL